MFVKSVKIVVTILAIELSFTSVQSQSQNEFSVIAANRGDFTYQASLRGQDSTHYCAGALISDRWILTSASCIINGGFNYISYATTIKLGGHDVREGYSYLLELIKAHEHFRGDIYEYDVALAQTNRPILFNKFIQPIPYFKGSLNGDIKECHTNDAVAIGWGFFGGLPPSPFITYRNLTILSKAGCEAIWQNAFGSEIVSSTVLCTQYKPGNVMNGTCYHEYGLPLSTSDTRVLLGIYAGYPYSECEISSRPNIYTRIADVADWIFENTNVDGVTTL